ncbi:aspartate kinase [Aneurinibacillus tyrosinisolvens]|uniref:aspartate kinase n=1 Tax=Aneurinibacillus tyrosinisolvens TaxID=1443435 RepID=UPI00063EDDD0|nr:aspartate kinase [Aneurinibacillus tyrosinisolvens]
MSLIVQKYGGTSVGTVERIQKVAERVAATRDAGHDVVVVVSAMGKSTDVLVDMAKEITDSPSPREMDMLLTTGEQVSIALLTMALQARGQEAVSMTGWQAGISTEAIHTKARIQHIDRTPIDKALSAGNVVIVAGFQGVAENGQITTLGRGGSDTTAVALAAALGADLCEIYTDVDGIYTADPRIAPAARKLARISYDEMLELATLGAGVLHPRAVECAKNYKVKLTVRSSFGHEEGTIVEEEADMEQGLVVSGIAHDKNIAKVTVAGLPAKVGTLSKLFNTLAAEHINVDIIIQSSYENETTDVSFSVSGEEVEKTRDVLEKQRDALSFSNIMTEEGLAKVSIVGAGMITNAGVAADMFSCLAEAGVRIKMVSTSEIKVSCVVPGDKVEIAVQSLHSAFGLDAKEKAVVHGV